MPGQGISWVNFNWSNKKLATLTQGHGLWNFSGHNKCKEFSNSRNHSLTLNMLNCQIDQYLENPVKIKFSPNVCFIKIRSKLTSVLQLCLLRIFMKQTLPMLLWYNMLQNGFKWNQVTKYHDKVLKHLSKWLKKWSWSWTLRRFWMALKISSTHLAR